MVLLQAIAYHRTKILPAKLAKYMVTPIQIDQNLLQEALDLSNHLTATALVEEALREYIQRRQQLKVLELFGTIDYEENYNHKQQR